MTTPDLCSQLLSALRLSTLAESVSHPEVGPRLRERANALIVDLSEGASWATHAAIRRLRDEISRATSGEVSC